MSVNEEALQDILTHSFKDFHCRGFDYICLKRSPERTLKVYFFDGDVSKLPEVVIPHDHRYGFQTTVLSGCVENRTYFTGNGEYVPWSNAFEEFEYQTPLNGGDGFTWKRTVDLYNKLSNWYDRGCSYRSTSKDIHTIQIRGPRTVLILEQGPDEVPEGVPTRAFRPARQGKVPPSLDGLYNKFTADEALARIRQIKLLAEDLQ